MSVDWEQTFRNWSKPSSDAELTKAENAERMIREAIKGSNELSKINISVFTQGSYKNNTNVRKDSDVDICVCCNDIIYSDYSLAPNMNDSLAGLIPATYHYSNFKYDLQRALEKKFGVTGVSSGQKAFDVHENTYRIDADVVPTIVCRLYSKDGTYRQGTQLKTGSGLKINNWPQQHYDNGISKNKRTGNRFKFIVRAIKTLRNMLEKNGYESAKLIPSYLVECLVYLVPDHHFTGNYYEYNVKDCINYLFDQIKISEQCDNWTEINGIKYLFRSSQKWTKAQVAAFLQDSRDYIHKN